MTPIIYQWGRSGGTLLNRCLVAMGNLVLSEIHPEITEGLHSPYWQAYKWWRMNFKAQVKPDRNFSRTDLWLQHVQRVQYLAEKRKMPVVIRDWTTMSFYPFLDTIPLLSCLKTHTLFEDAQTCAFVRNGIDSTLSFIRFHQWTDRRMIDGFAEAYRKYAEAVVAHGCPVFRYEELCADTPDVLRKMASHLGLKYSEDWKNFDKVKTVHGDTNPKRSRGAGLGSVAQLPRRATASPLDAYTREHPHLKAANLILGYENA